MDKTIPTYTEVKNIFNETYNKFYLKWKDIQNEDDFKTMWDEAKSIGKKYNSDLSKNILINLCKIIEHEFLQRGSE